MIIKYPLILFLIVPILAILFHLRSDSNVHTIKFPKVASMLHLSSKKHHRLLKTTRILEFLIICLTIIAMSQPQLITSERFQTKNGIDIIALLDTSGSMNAEDFKPKNRMEVAKETLSRFIKKRPNDRIGLVIFGTDAFTKSPLTYDHNIVHFHVNQTSVGEAGEGTAIGLAIATGISRLNKSTSKSKIMILITDGVNNTGQIDPISATTLAKKKNIKIYSIGIGDKKGAPIPIYHPSYGKRYARYPNGKLILTEFDDRTLKIISKETNAKYFNAKNTSQLADIFKQIDTLEKTVIKTSKKYQTIDLFPALIATILCLFLFKETLISTSLVGVRT